MKEINFIHLSITIINGLERNKNYNNYVKKLKAIFLNE